MNAEEIYKRNKGEVYYDSRTDSYGNKIKGEVYYDSRTDSYGNKILIEEKKE